MNEGCSDVRGRKEPSYWQVDKPVRPEDAMVISELKSSMGPLDDGEFYARLYVARDDSGRLNRDFSPEVARRLRFDGAPLYNTHSYGSDQIRGINPRLYAQSLPTKRSKSLGNVKATAVGSTGDLYIKGKFDMSSLSRADELALRNMLRREDLRDVSMCFSSFATESEALEQKKYREGQGYYCAGPFPCGTSFINIHEVSVCKQGFFTGNTILSFKASKETGTELLGMDAAMSDATVGGASSGTMAAGTAAVEAAPAAEQAMAMDASMDRTTAAVTPVSAAVAAPQSDQLQTFTVTQQADQRPSIAKVAAQMAAANSIIAQKQQQQAISDLHADNRAQTAIQSIAAASSDAARKQQAAAEANAQQQQQQLQNGKMEIDMEEYRALQRDFKQIKDERAAEIEKSRATEEASVASEIDRVLGRSMPEIASFLKMQIASADRAKIEAVRTTIRETAAKQQQQQQQAARAPPAVITSVASPPVAKAPRSDQYMPTGRMQSAVIQPIGHVQVAAPAPAEPAKLDPYAAAIVAGAEQLPNSMANKLGMTDEMAAVLRQHFTAPNSVTMFPNVPRDVGGAPSTAAASASGRGVSRM